MAARAGFKMSWLRRAGKADEHIALSAERREAMQMLTPVTEVTVQEMEGMILGKRKALYRQHLRGNADDGI